MMKAYAGVLLTGNCKQIGVEIKSFNREIGVQK
jgi:hypothetical protein